MEILSPQEKPATELSYAEREGILWDAARRYMGGEITAQELSEIEDRYSQSIRKIVIHSPITRGEREHTMTHKIDIYNDYAAQYAEMVTAREEAGIEHEPIMPQFLKILGDVSGLITLDAGCGEGYLSRILARRGAQVTGIDIAARLIQLARAKDPEGKITYQVVDLSQPLPVYERHFDLIASHLVLNDVYDYRGFLTTLAAVAKPGGRLVLSMNNPYSFVLRNHIANYFDSGKAFPYRGMSEEGVKVHFYHRTLEEYLDACFTAGFKLQRLVDIPTPEGTFKRRSDTLLPIGYQFPFFMILSLIKR